MKRLSFTALLLLVFATLWANPVSREQAQAYAESYFSSMTQRQLTARNIEAVGTGNATDYYIINFYPQGWAIISGDDNATPVIGYSRTGSLSRQQMPENMRAAMDGFSNIVRRVANERHYRNLDWDQPEYVVTRAGSEGVEPLIEVRWNQPSPFNKYCPMGKALVGCVAVAMSQAMSVQRYPDRPRGSVSYRSAEYGQLAINFDEEKAYNWDDIMSGANNYDETARLLMHAGMAVEMDYGEDGSGVLISRLAIIAQALMKNFKYPDGVRAVHRDTYEEDWAQLIMNELNAGRAVVYNGLDTKNSSGHSWNVDGYDSEGRFHCNWGWGGSGNGYFSLNGLGTSGSYYDASHIAIIGIGAPTQTLRSISLSNSDIEEALPAGSIVGKVTVNGNDVPAGYKVEVHGTYSRTVGGYQTVPFTYEDGMLKTTEALAKDKKWTVEITVSDGENELTQGFVVNVTGVMGLAEATALTYDRTTKTFTVTTKNNVSYSLQNAQGTVVKSGSLSLPQLDIERSELTTGENSLTLRSANESITLIIKK